MTSTLCRKGTLSQSGKEYKDADICLFAWLENAVWVHTCLKLRPVCTCKLIVGRRSIEKDVLVPIQQSTAFSSKVAPERGDSWPRPATRMESLLYSNERRGSWPHQLARVLLLGMKIFCSRWKMVKHYGYEKPALWDESRHFVAENENSPSSCV